mmetsp:Transcript_39570/g.127170  ORF Transcript_39570/g.127170 Transcript_39570/m.127170 type:complete len:280 (-) Transcript_39570:811-1650(-)
MRMLRSFAGHARVKGCALSPATVAWSAQATPFLWYSAIGRSRNSRAEGPQPSPLSSRLAMSRSMRTCWLVLRSHEAKPATGGKRRITSNANGSSCSSRSSKPSPSCPLPYSPYSTAKALLTTEGTETPPAKSSASSTADATLVFSRSDKACHSAGTTRDSAVRYSTRRAAFQALRPSQSTNRHTAAGGPPAITRSSCFFPAKSLAIVLETETLSSALCRMVCVKTFASTATVASLQNERAASSMALSTIEETAAAGPTNLSRRGRRRPWSSALSARAIA